MKNIVNILPIILFLLSGCNSPSPEEVTIQKLIPAIEKEERAQSITPLLGGKSKTMLFLVTSSSGHKYVARFFSHENQGGREQMIKKQQIASQAGYGPLVSYASASN